MNKESVITDWTEFCLICGGEAECEHHAIPGTANRAKSEEFKLVIPLCNNCHNMSRDSIHRNPKMAAMSKIIGQLAFAKEYFKSKLTASENEKRQMEQDAKEMFIDTFGKSYL